MNNPNRWIITGVKGAGKTSFCSQLVARAQSMELEVAGILSLGIFENGVKTGIKALDLRSGTSRILASRLPDQLEDGVQFCGWHFSLFSLAWVNDVLRKVSPCDLLVIDEIGKYEFDYHGGFTAAFPVFQDVMYKCSVVAVRYEYHQQMLKLWPGSRCLEIRSKEDASNLAQSFKF